MYHPITTAWANTIKKTILYFLLSNKQLFGHLKSIQMCSVHLTWFLC